MKSRRAPDVRVIWAVALAAAALGFLLALPAEGWLEVLADVLFVGGVLVSTVAYLLHARGRGSWSSPWWKGWNDPR